MASAEGRSGPRAVHVHGLDFERIRHHGNATDLAVLKDLIEAGKVRPLIDRAFSLADVPEAMRYLREGSGRKGKIVINV